MFKDIIWVHLSQHYLLAYIITIYMSYLLTYDIYSLIYVYVVIEIMPQEIRIHMIGF